jgi:hypothetical protein
MQLIKFSKKGLFRGIIHYSPVIGITTPKLPKLLNYLRTVFSALIVT